jgi:signal peptidase II
LERLHSQDPGPEDLEEEPEELYRPSLPGWMSRLADPVLLVALSGVFAADQVSKAVVRNSLLVGHSVPYDGPVRITHAFNTGSAFGLFPDQTMFLVLASLFGIGVLLAIYGTQAFRTWPLRLSIGMQLGGAVGNLLDRLRMGHVTDFIDVGPWPIFNVADAAIVVGLLIIARAFLFPSGRRTAAPGTAPGVYADGLMPGLPCPICGSEMAAVPRGRRCFECGVEERVDRSGAGL